jgi:hypothetical protein
MGDEMRLARSLADRAPTRTIRSFVVLMALTGCAAFVTLGFSFASQSEAGYGDTYILHDLLHFQRTGQIYRDPAQPPYLPSQYSPLAYLVLAAPGALFDLSNPFVGPRVIVLCAFLVCVWCVFRISRRLMPAHGVGLWSTLVVTSISIAWPWLLQMRADFPGVASSLLAIVLLLSGRPGAAGLAAGLAFQFKLTLIASGLAGLCWLWSRREWPGLVRFIVGGLTTSAGLYVAFRIREPRMVDQMLALAPGVRDVSGAAELFWSALCEPVVPLAGIGFMTLGNRPRQAWRLLLAYGAIALAVAMLTSLQAGAGAYYYLEPAFAAVPLAVRGVLCLRRLPRRHADVVLASALALVAAGLPLRVQHLQQALFYQPAMMAGQESLTKALATTGARRVFSTIPQFALLDPEPALVEPYLLAYLRRLGRPDGAPVIARVERGEFDVAFTATIARSWRGVPHIDPSVHRALETAYEPYCALGMVLVHLPRVRKSSDNPIASALTRSGCQRIPSGTALPW